MGMHRHRIAERTCDVMTVRQRYCQKIPSWLAGLMLGCLIIAALPAISFGADRAAASLESRLDTLGFVKMPQHQDAPDFTLQDISGKSFRLADQRGKVIFLTFWTTW